MKTPKQTVLQFLEKEVVGVETVVKAICAFITKEEPKVEKVLAEAIAAYKLAVEALPQIEATITALAILIADISAAL
jgi:hypothetical protein